MIDSVGRCTACGKLVGTSLVHECLPYLSTMPVPPVSSAQVDELLTILREIRDVLKIIKYRLP